jgi:hypothetical protein
MSITSFDFGESNKAERQCGWKSRVLMWRYRSRRWHQAEAAILVMMPRS